MPDGTTFISGTLVNDSGTQQIGNPANGIQIGNINPSGMAVITINALVINIPSINPISNSSSVQFQHIVNPSQPVITQTASSNTVITTINSAILTTTKALINPLFLSVIRLRIQPRLQIQEIRQQKHKIYKRYSS